MSLDVLFIEDEPELQELVKVNLSLRGISVDVSDTGSEGLQKFIEEWPKVVLLDVRLPDIDGWDLCKRMKELSGGTHTPAIIFLTAATQERDRTMANEAGADGFISKPFEISELISEVRKKL